MRCWQESYESYYGVASDFPSSGEHLFFEIEDEDSEEIILQISEMIEMGDVDNVKQKVSVWLYCDLLNEDVEVEDIEVGDYFTQEQIDEIIKKME
jgi:hypothetical protein